MSESINEFINNSLIYYFNKINKFTDEINIMNNKNKFKNKDKQNKINIFQNWSENNFYLEFIDLNRKYDFEVFGLYSNISKVFSWGWVLPNEMYGKTYLVKKLFDYAYQKNVVHKYQEVDFFLKVMLSNSRITINYQEQIDLILAISSFILKETDKFQFIISNKKYMSDNPDDFYIIYYILKNQI